MSEHVQCIVIGAGVVGLATAREMARQGIETIIVEKAGSIGTETSSRNSEVIHAGIYYPKQSLKAQLCVSGKYMLYDFCEKYAVPYKRIGKMIVATDSAQRESLHRIISRAQQNGVNDLSWLKDVQVKEMAPELSVSHALFSPSSGIIDSHQFMLSLQGDFEHHNGMVAFNTAFVSAERVSSGWKVYLKDNDSYSVECDYLINSAGLHAVDVARSIVDLPPTTIPKQYYAKGNYFSCNAQHNFEHLIYPVPNADGLGIHLTLDLSGNIRFGPDVEWVSEMNYHVDKNKRASFYKAISAYWPDISENSLSPDYAGIRPKIHPAGTKDTDFLIQSGVQHSLPGLVNLFGIESPGITASLALAKMVSDIILLK